MRAYTLPALTGLAVLAVACSPASSPDETDQQDGMDHGSDSSVMTHSMSGDEAAPVPGADDVAPVLDVRAVWMRPHPGGRDVTAAYFTARLSEGQRDTLVAARIEGAERVELHGHLMGEGGVMQMRALGPQEITAAGPMVFTPGGRHLMVYGLPTVVEGDEVEGVLVFERAGEVSVRFSVRSMPPGQVTEY